MKNLFFDYSSGSKIRFRKSSCFKHDKHPYVYRIITKRLDFLVPKKMTILTEKYIYIPLDYYKKVLINFYLKL